MTKVTKLMKLWLKEKWCLQELKEWLDYYNLKEDTVAINVLPNAQKNC